MMLLYTWVQNSHSLARQIYIYFVVVHHIAKMYCSGRWPAAGAALLAKCASAVILFILLKIMSLLLPFQLLVAWGVEATRH